MFIFSVLVLQKRLTRSVYERYFAEIRTADVAGIVEEALAAWFGKGGMVDVPDQ